MGGRDHSCEGCGRGGFNDPDGKCECPDNQPPKPGLSDEQRVESWDHFESTVRTVCNAVSKGDTPDLADLIISEVCSLYDTAISERDQQERFKHRANQRAEQLQRDLATMTETWHAAMKQVRRLDQDLIDSQHFATQSHDHQDERIGDLLGRAEAAEAELERVKAEWDAAQQQLDLAVCDVNGYKAEVTRLRSELGHLQKVAADRRYSDEFVGNLARSTLADLSPEDGDG